jgi:ABC-2 type transport system ATP-binding protein
VTSSTPDALWSSRSVRLLRPAAVEVRGLRSRPGRANDGGSSLQGLDLAVPVGARLLLVSRPESAGTLLLRILAGLVRPAAGSITLAGIPRSDQSPSGWPRRVAHVGSEPAIYAWLSPVEALSLAADLAGLERREAARRVDELVDHFRLGLDATRPIGRGGPAVAQKAALAAALVAEPEVLLLDEPLRALDNAERRRLLHLPRPRLTLVMGSRYPASEEGLVNQVALIRDGRLALHATVDELSAASLPLSARGIEALADLRAEAAPH